MASWNPRDLGAAAAGDTTSGLSGAATAGSVYGWGVEGPKDCVPPPPTAAAAGPATSEVDRQQQQHVQHSIGSSSRNSSTSSIGSSSNSNRSAAGGISGFGGGSGGGSGGGRGGAAASSMAGGGPAAVMPVDDPLVVKRMTSQVESSSITTRNGAIQREMQDAYRKLICANVERKLTLQDVASFSTFLVGVRVRLHEKGSNLRRRHSVLSSLIKHAPRARVQRIYSDLAAVEEQESALTKDVDLFNKLQQDLKESPAYKAMMEYGQSSGMVNVDGTMMPDPTKHPELEAMAAMSVKDMLAEFKKEDKRNEAQSSNSNRSAGADEGLGPESAAGSGGGGGRLGAGRGGDGPAPNKSKKGKKGKKDRRR
ncbi:unnamed protein product [Pylaiella littoralis]